MSKNGFRPMSRKSCFTIKCYDFITFLNRDFCTGFRLKVQWGRGVLAFFSVAILCSGKK